MKQQLCGLRPTGRLHLGHFFSVIEPGRQGCRVLIANYHAPDQHEHVNQIADTLERFGCTKIRMQADVFSPDLFFRLLSLAPIGALERMTQYKAAAPEDRTAQLLTYPVLMAHDVAGFDEVLVGDDQQQHLEYARDLLQRYNRTYEPVTIPTAKIVVGRIKDLKNPDRKMSKSEPDGCLFLDDTPDVIRQKIKRATMDDAGRQNLIWLYQQFVGDDVPQTNQPLKEQLAEALITVLRPSAASCP